ncbi:MAG: hypothetical protein LRZ84_14730 [Desertifilum sp.]|nr:hypothetical protein [Desertifilum sp.]
MVTANSKSFTPVYSYGELESLISRFANKSLDTVTSGGTSVFGVRDCEPGVSGLRALSLVQRFTSDDVEGAIAQFLAVNRTLAAIFILRYIFDWQIEEICLGLGDPSIRLAEAHSLIQQASDEFMRILL